MKNYTIAFNNIDTIDALIDESFPYNNKTLIQIFCASTDKDEIQKIQTYFNNKFNTSTIIGATTDGTIKEAKVHNGTKTVVTFTTFEETTLKSTLIHHKKKYDCNYTTGKILAKQLCSEDTKVIISFADGINTNGEEYVKGISEVSPSTVIAGGLAGDNGAISNTYVFDNKHIINSGVVGVSLNSESLNVTTSYIFDWTPIGKKLHITKAIKNRVYEIDGISAIDMYARYMGDDIAKKLPQIGIEFPLVFEKDGVLVGRAVLLKHNDGSLTFAGNIEEGTEVYFGIGNVENILSNSDYHVHELMNKMKYKPEAIFIYSCMARRRFMNKYIKYELGAFSNLGHISGFFTYGEFFHTQNSNQFLNETMTVVALSEKKIEISQGLKKQMKLDGLTELDKEHVLAHLANTVSKELADLNDNLEKRIEESSVYIYKQAYFDKLTGLPNRLSLIQRLDASLGKTVVLINIDDFTSINDFYGHEFGDKILKKLAKVLNKFIGDEPAEIFKLPSDEFAIILDINKENSTIEDRIKQCTNFINEESFYINGHDTHVSVTVAAALVNKNKNGFANADMTLKLAKKAGKEYMVFNNDLELSKKYKENLLMANSIKTAIQTNNIIAYYQPIFCIKTGKVQKYEALARLMDENGKILSPYAFLDISQKIKLYPQITKIMIEKTFSYFKQNTYNFSINLAFSDILNEKTREFLFRKMDEYSIAKQLTIEILETQESDNSQIVDEFIENVYKHGASIAIDDFGSGFANFQHMTTMRSDTMKIDGSLIKNIDIDKNARLVVETIIVFTKKLNKKIVAEFVHSKDVYDIVKELGIDYAQGYYLGKPQATVL